MLRLLSSTNAICAAVVYSQTAPSCTIRTTTSLLLGDFQPFKSCCCYPRHHHHFRSPRSTIAFAFVGIASRSATSRSSKYAAMIHASQKILPMDRPPDPSSFSSIDIDDSSSSSSRSSSYAQQQAIRLRDWMLRGDKKEQSRIVCITGAGLSTESGIPDYRGNNGSYFRGHKPIIHHEFMSSPTQRKRYWARSLVGYSPFANAQPNLGHLALAKLEMMGYIGVKLEDCTDFVHLGASCTGQSLLLDGGRRRGAHEGNMTMAAAAVVERKMSIITQNVDTLHSKAGIKHCLHLHGRGDLVRCMSCGLTRDRKHYHDELSVWNQDWLNKYYVPDDDDVLLNGRMGASSPTNNKRAELRPDGDAELGHQETSYDEFVLPSCSQCGKTMDDDDPSFFKTDVVFFGDSVPKHRFEISNAAIDAADGVLCIGTSLAVHSAFRLAKRAIESGTPLAILNVGQTRVEREGLGGGGGAVTKVESPIGETLHELAKILNEEKENSV